MERIRRTAARATYTMSSPSRTATDDDSWSSLETRSRMGCDTRAIDVDPR
jgi:hypothetical protein